MTDLLNLDKVENNFTLQAFVKKLNSCWNGQYTNSESGVFAQTNSYLNALFNPRFLGINKEISEIKKEYQDLKDEMFLDTEILLKEGCVTVYDITEISILCGGKVIVTLKNGKKEEVYTRNRTGRELMLVSKVSQINLRRPGIEEYYKQNKNEYPGIMKLNDCFKNLPTPKTLRSGISYQTIAQDIYNHLELTPQKLMLLIKEYRRFHKECGYQLCHEKFKGTD